MMIEENYIYSELKRLSKRVKLLEKKLYDTNEYPCVDHLDLNTTHGKNMNYFREELEYLYMYIQPVSNIINANCNKAIIIDIAAFSYKTSSKKVPARIEFDDFLIHSIFWENSEFIYTHPPTMLSANKDNLYFTNKESNDVIVIYMIYDERDNKSVYRITGAYYTAINETWEITLTLNVLN